MSLNESLTPGRAAPTIPLRPQRRGGFLGFGDDAQQPVPDAPAPAARQSGGVLDFFEQQCASANRQIPRSHHLHRFHQTHAPCRFFGLMFGGGCCGREQKKDLPKGEEPPPIVEDVPEKLFPLHSALKKVPLLAGLSDADLHKLESVCELHTYVNTFPHFTFVTSCACTCPAS